MRPRTLTPPLPAPTPWWLDEARTHRADAPASALDGSVDADVAVVGGGYTGLWTALALRERDPSLRVVLLEARRVGEGPSGRNGGFLHGYWSSLAMLRAVLGDGPALQLAHASSRIVPAVRTLLERRGEDVWLREGGLLKVAATAAEDGAVDRALEAARALGVEEEAVALDAAAVRARIDSPRFRRGVHFRDGAIVQPARLALALKRAALDEGVELHESSPVTAAKWAGSPPICAGCISFHRSQAKMTPLPPQRSVAKVRRAFTAERAKSLPADDWRSRNAEFTGAKLKANLELAETMKAVGMRHGTGAAAAAIAWTLAWPGVSGAIVGAREPRQVDGWIDAAARYETQLSTFWADRQALAVAIMRHADRTGAGSPAVRLWRSG